MVPHCHLQAKAYSFTEMHFLIAYYYGHGSTSISQQTEVCDWALNAIQRQVTSVMGQMQRNM